MTVMLLQRFSAPQSTLAQKKYIKNSCDNEVVVGCGEKESQQPLNLISEEYQRTKKTNHQERLTSAEIDYYSNNINDNNNYSEKVKNTTNSCKTEKFRRTSSCLHAKTVNNINNNSNNNNNNNNNTNNNNNNNSNSNNNNNNSSNNINNNNLNNNNNENVRENDLLSRDKETVRQETITSRTTTITAGTTGTIGTSGSQGRYCGQGVAMRYYRLWIYACNIVLLGSALGLAAALLRSFVFTRDPRRYLVPGVPRVFDPTALYAYLALATQLGLVQLLGCIAARRLSAKLLNAYWVLLLALLFGDAIIGVAWVFKFERIRAELRPTLRFRLQLDYGRDTRFSENWDRLQRDFSCCGVTGPNDFANKFYPETCCPVISTISSGYTSANNETTNDCHQPFLNGCEESLLSWMRKTADFIFVIGFCVMAFSKLCFLGILRYEIREMIQKIQLLRDPPPPASATFIQSFCQPQQPAAPLPTSLTSQGGSSHGITTATFAGTETTGHSLINYGGTRRTTLPIVVSSSIATNNPSSFGNNMPILTQQYEQEYSGKHPLLFSNNLQQDGGADSDTNSHCALILEESMTTPPSQRNCTGNPTREKSNYEMREFNRRYLMSNGGSPPTGIKIVPQNRRT